MKVSQSSVSHDTETLSHSSNTLTVAGGVSSDSRGLQDLQTNQLTFFKVKCLVLLEVNGNYILVVNGKEITCSLIKKQHCLLKV